jgi:DNA-directed RNA polymerase specialized sigma24 family protein
VPPSEISPDKRPEPLTHCNRDGVPYRRDGNVERQILAVASLSTDDLLGRARITDGTALHFLQEETLAYLIRRAHREGDDALVDGLAEVLVGRCTRYLKALLRGLRPDPLEEAIAEALADLFERLVEPEGSDRGDFLQVRFWVVVKRLAKAAARRAWEESDTLLVAIDPTGGGSDDEEDHRVQLPDPMATAPDTQLLIDEALALLEPNVRTAFLLRAEGWPVEDRDPTVPTISRLFGKTSRTIRYWLSQAEEQLATWRTEEKTS